MSDVVGGPEEMGFKLTFEGKECIRVSSGQRDVLKVCRHCQVALIQSFLKTLLNKNKNETFVLYLRYSKGEFPKRSTTRIWNIL